MNPLSKVIKDATKEDHQALEKKVVERLKNIKSKGDYADLLKYFHNYFDHLEKAIAPFLTEEIRPNYKDRRTSEHLRNDLLALQDVPVSFRDITIPVISNSLEAIGALYVMEGSIMGGGIIVKMLAKKGITKGISFFSGYGEDTLMIWNAFQKAMNTSAYTQEQKLIIIHTAQETFRHFSQLFDAVPTFSEPVMLNSNEFINTQK